MAVSLTVDEGLDSSEEPARGFFHVHPDTLASLGARLGSLLVVVSADGLTCVSEVWPDRGTAPGRIRLDRVLRHYAPYPAKTVLRARLADFVLPAASIVLDVEDPTVRIGEHVRTYIRDVIRSLVVVCGGCIRVPIRGQSQRLRVKSGEPVQPVESSAGPLVLRITDRTIVTFAADATGGSQTPGGVQSGALVAAPPPRDPAAPCGLRAVGGLRAQVARVREAVEGPLLRPETFAALGMRPPRGVLLYGPPGTGKTLLARSLAAELAAAFFVLNGADIVSKYYGETETRLRDVFAAAQAARPAILFLDEIDALAPKRTEAASETEARTVAALLALLESVEGVVVLAATNRPDALDPALRRPGRLDREIEIGIPTAAEREDILRVLLADTPHALTDDDIRHVAGVTHAFVGADLAALVREAALRCVRRLVRVSSTGAAAAAAAAVVEAPRISRDDVQRALVLVRPSALREVAVEVPTTRWDDIGGYDELKRRLREAIEWPLRMPEAFARLGVRPPKGVLLYGPPGCSKTLLAKALATESGMNFIAVKGPEVFSKWVGESERAVREVFRKARAGAPCVVFFDEIDAVGLRRGAGGEGGVGDRVLAQLLSELDGARPLTDVVLLAATNRPDALDPALLRPGRIDRILFVGLPDSAARRAILAVHTRRMPLGADVAVDRLAELTAGYSGAEVAAVCREAALAAMRERIDTETVEFRHFTAALSIVRPRTDAALLSQLQQFRLSCGVDSV